MILSLILAFTAPTVKPNVEYIPQYSYYYNIAKNRDLKSEIKKSKANKPLEIANTVTVEQPEGFLIDTDNKLSKDEIIGLIRDYSVKYNVDPERSIRIAKCESGFNPLAKSKSGTYLGLYQWDKSFDGWAKRLGIENPDRYNAHQNIEISMYVMSFNLYSKWSCK